MHQQQEFQPFRTADVFVRTGAPHVDSFIRSALQEMKAPTSVRERNMAQLVLAERLLRQFELGDLTKAVECVAPLYAAKFPHQPPKSQVVRRQFPH